MISKDVPIDFSVSISLKHPENMKYMKNKSSRMTSSDFKYDPMSFMGFSMKTIQLSLLVSPWKPSDWSRLIMALLRHHLEMLRGECGMSTWGANHPHERWMGFTSPIGSMYAIYIYTIHGSYGSWYLMEFHGDFMGCFTSLTCIYGLLWRLNENEWDLLGDIPSGKRLHSELENHPSLSSGNHL